MTDRAKLIARIAVDLMVADIAIGQKGWASRIDYYVDQARRIVSEAEVPA